VTIRREDASTAAVSVLDCLVGDGRLVRDGEVVRRHDVAPAGPDPALAAAMDRLEAALDVPAPPPLEAAARTAGCPPDGIRDLERTARIVVLAPDLAYSAATYRELTSRALAMAAREPLTPAAYRDATGTSRKYVMAILEDLDRRAILRRTPDGHVPGPRAPATITR
jgi:selenocysteine-specific elongation factor